MIISKDSTPEQKEALRQALRQQSLQMAARGAAPEDIQSLPEDFEPPSYSENTRPLYDGQLFPQIKSADDLIANGYATPDGQPTEQGKMAISLKKVGALNDDYTLNDTGKAMMASRDDLLKEENLPLYIKSKELGLDGTGELSWGDTFNSFLGELKKGGKELVDLIEYDTKDMTPEEQAEYDLRSSGLISGAAKMGAALPMGVAKIAGTSIIKGIIDDEQTQESALASFNQKFERTQDDINNTNTAEFVDALGEISGVNLNFREGREKAIALVGEEKAREFEGGGESAGGFAATFNPYGPAMLTAKVAFGVAGKGLGAAFQPISRSLLQADAKAAEVLAKTKQLSTLQRQASGLQLATQAAEKQAATAESMAQKFSQAGFTDRANNALRLANQARTKGQEAVVRLGGFTDEIATVSDDLANATQSATVADKVLQMTQKAGQIPYLPITLLGKSLEYTGRGMIGIDKGLSNLAAKVGADKAYNAMNKITTLSGLGGVGVASGLGPAAFIPAAIKATWSTAPFIKATGEYIGLMGKEAMKARGQIGFWKRMYEMPNKGPMHRAVSGLMDTATLGGRVTGAAGRVGKGLAASYPVDLAFEWVAEGGEMNPNVLKQAAVETLVFGGTGAALGGITMGSAERIRSLQNGDATNFYRSITDPSQRVMFNGMAPDLKRAIGTFSASNPGAKVEFVTQGEGVYDRNTKTVMVNPNARNPLKPLLTHEFMHHMLNNGIGDGVVAQLVGDGYQTGGILRSKDGGYEQQYEEFKSEYVNRLRQQHERNIKLRDAIGDPVSKSERAFQVPDEKYLAEEYFIETNVDDMLGLVESGKLGKMAGRMVLNDKVRALGDAILNKSAILRDLHFRIGGVMDKQGKMVKGNGFLGGQLYQSPEIRRMFNKMVNESVGRRGGIDAAKMKARNGIELPISGKSDPILGEMSSLWESDADGNPLIDKNGDYIPLSKQTDELRSQAGMLLVDDLRARQSRGEAIPDGELAYNPENNTWSGQYLNDRQIELLSLSGRFNSKQIKQLKLMNESARATSDPNADPAARGHRFSVIYQSALKKNRKGQWRYDQIKPQLRDVVPYGVEISKDGNILIRIMSTNQLFANASEKATSKRGRSLYDGNMDSILRDANAIIDLHGKNQATDAYFKDKYGAQWAFHKEFINSVFGNVGKGHKDINPLVASDRVSAVVKSYRLDRMNKATQLVGATQLPYQNNLIKINYLPEGEPILDENGEPKDLRYTPSYEESQVRMPEAQRAMPEGVSPEDLNPVANKQEAQGLWADGKRMFALNEMDEKLTPITSKAMLDSYSADAIGWIEPEAQTRFMPEKLDSDYMKAVESGDVKMQQRIVDEAAISSVKEAYIPINKLKTTEKIQDKQVVDEIASKIENPDDVDWDYYPALIITPDMKVRDGHHRLEAFKKTGVDKARTLIVPYDIWKTEVSNGNLDGLVKWAANAIDDPVTGNQPNLYGRPIKNIDPITRDDSGNVIPPSKRFNVGSGDMRHMPEPLPANYQSSRDTTFLYQSIGPDGIVNLNRPIKSTEALPTISTRHEYPVEDFTVSKFDKRASILYAKNKNGEGVSFKFDPQLMKQPEFADFDDLYDGAVVQLAMADRHGATDGDMGGHSFPDLKVNQDIIVDDGNGNEYKLVWSNNAWGPVKNMSTKAQKYGATTLLTYNMDQHAHDSNTRTVRIFSNEIANSNLSAKDQNTLLIVMNVALKKAQSSANKQDLRALLKTKKDLIDLLKKDDKAISQAKGYVGKKPLSSEEGLALENEIEGNQKDIDDENQFLKESLGVKLAGDEEVKVDALFRDYQNKRRAYEKNTKSESRKKAMVDAEKALKAYQKTKEFKKAEGLLPSRELDRFSNTFKGRKSLILAVKNKEASVKWHGFDSQKISQAIGDQLTGDSLHIVSSVELSSDPNFKAVYLGDDPREIARMSPSEQKAALQLKANPNFVAHEAYLWSMLGPAESKHIYNTNQRSVLESFPNFLNEYSKLPVKPGKLKLNDPNSKASEFNIVNTIRDQSKIGIVFRAEKGKNKETKSQRNGRQ